MVVNRESIEARLEELDEILGELSRYRGITVERIRRNLSQQWIIERGLIAAAALILDVANHILAGHFGVYPDSYEESLEGLRNKEVISDDLYSDIRGLGGFRNILVHRYQEIDVGQVMEHYDKALTVFPRFSAEVLAWLDDVGAQERNGDDGDQGEIAGPAALPHRD